MSAVFAAMMEGDASFGVVILDFPRDDRCNPDEWLKVIDAVDAAKAKSANPWVYSVPCRKRCLKTLRRVCWPVHRSDG